MGTMVCVLRHSHNCPKGEILLHCKCRRLGGLPPQESPPHAPAEPPEGPRHPHVPTARQVPSMVQGGILPPPRTGPNYAASFSGTASAATSTGTAATAASATLTGAFAMIINDALFAASCKDLVER